MQKKKSQNVFILKDETNIKIWRKTNPISYLIGEWKKMDFFFLSQTPVPKITDASSWWGTGIISVS